MNDTDTIPPAAPPGKNFDQYEMLVDFELPCEAQVGELLPDPGDATSAPPPEDNDRDLQHGWLSAADVDETLTLGSTGGSDGHLGQDGRQDGQDGHLASTASPRPREPLLVKGATMATLPPGHGHLAGGLVAENNQRQAACDVRDRADREALAKSGAITRFLSEVVERPVRWLWPGWLSAGALVVLAGDPGLGKTLAWLDWMARLTTGRPWPDGAPALEGPGDVLVLSFEDAPDTVLKPRLRAAGGDPHRVLLLEGVMQAGRRRAFDLERDVARIEEALGRLPHPLAVVLDPIAASLGTRTDTHRDAAVRSLLAPLADLAAGQDVLLLAVAHLRKSGREDLALSVGGSVAFVAAPRVALGVVRHPEDEDARLLVPVKNNLAPMPDARLFRVEPHGEGLARIAWGEAVPEWRALLAAGDGHADREAPRLQEAEDFLHQELAAGPRLQTDLEAQAKEGGITPRTLRRAKKKIGVMATREDASWWWALAAQGPEGE